MSNQTTDEKLISLKHIMHRFVGKRFNKESKKEACDLMMNIVTDGSIKEAAEKHHKENPRAIFHMPNMLDNIRHNVSMGHLEPSEMVFLCNIIMPEKE